MHRPVSGAQPHPQLSAPLAREGAVCREETVATAVRAAGHWAAMATLQGRSRGWLRKAGCGPVSLVNIGAGQWAVSPVLGSSRMSPIAQMRELGHLPRRAELWTELGPSSGLRGPKLQPSPGWGPAPKVLSQGPPGILPSSPRDTSQFSSARRQLPTSKAAGSRGGRWPVWGQTLFKAPGKPPSITGHTRLGDARSLCACRQPAPGFSARRGAAGPRPAS